MNLNLTEAILNKPNWRMRLAYDVERFVRERECSIDALGRAAMGSATVLRDFMRKSVGMRPSSAARLWHYMDTHQGPVPYRRPGRPRKTRQAH